MGEIKEVKLKAQKRQPAEHELMAVEKAMRDLFGSIVSTEKLCREEMRSVVKMYYDMQELRKAAANQKRQIKGKTTELLDYILRIVELVEDQVQELFEAWAAGHPPSSWAMDRVGIGPVLAVGLASSIDMERATNPSKIWRFAGLDPSVKWIGREGARKIVAELKEKDLTPEDAIPSAANRANVREETVLRFAKQYQMEKEAKELSWDHVTKALARCPWNARLKTLCWKIGDSFVKNSNRGSFYGKIYREAKAREEELDAAGDHGKEASRCMEERRGMTPNMKKYYRRGYLPPGRLDLRARRKAVKLFLTHWWEVAYRDHYRKEPPDPWIISHGGHADLITAEDAEQWEAENMKKPEAGKRAGRGLREL